jgi:DNA-binding transcriptional MocR family regulator
MAVNFATRVKLLKASEIREILKITVRPEIISFAGGLPAPEVFPVEEMKQAAARVLDEAGAQALQYSTTEGFEPLRRQVSARIAAKFAVKVDYGNILITNGSQQALDFAGKLFLDAGDVVLCESPTYLAAISAFRAYQPRFVEVPTDDEGMIVEELAKVLRSTPRIKFIYVVPDFQNPTGRTWSLERRRRFAELVQEYEVPVVEDNPYGELRFEGESLPAIKSFDTKGLVIFVSTFSKIFCPGMRIGWIAAAETFFEKFVLIKQGTDLHTSSISQQEIAKYLEMYDLDEHVGRIVELYRRRRDAMITTMDAEFPAGIRRTNPHGGLFTWVALPQGYNSLELLKRSLERQVAFVPGDSFFPNRRVLNTLRLNYSNMPEDRIREGICRLAAVIREYRR